MQDACRGNILALRARMCGFVGGILRRGVEDSDVRAFGRAVRLLAHRGPDDERVLVLPEARAVFVRPARNH